MLMCTQQKMNVLNFDSLEVTKFVGHLHRNVD